MTNAQKVNKHLKTKSNKKTTTAGSRAARKRLNHGKSKDSLKNSTTRRKR